MPLAIHFIRKLWDYISEIEVFKIYNETRRIVANNTIQSRNRGKTKVGTKGTALKFTAFDYAKAFNPLVELLRYSAGITASRSMLLKILSQPECSGVRFYLALKDREKADADRKAARFQRKFSPVMVGVDKKGTDLNYTYDTKYADKDNIPNIETRSLSGEYPGTSGLITPFGPKKMEGVTPYPLFQYAISNKMLKKAKRK